MTSYFFHDPKDTKELNNQDDKLEKSDLKPKINNQSFIMPSVICNDLSLITPLALLTVNKVNNAIYLIDRQAKVLWGYEFNTKSSLNQIEFAELTSKKTVIFGDQHKIYEINLSDKKIIRNLDYKVKSTSLTKDGNLLITDSYDNTVKEIDNQEQVIWYYINSHQSEPNHAIRLKNGNTLITYSDEAYVSEVTNDKNEVWSFGKFGKKGNDQESLNNPKYALRLVNGNTLITDNKNNRIIEVNENKNIVWNYQGSQANKLVLPNYAKRLKNGNTYIAHTGNRQFLEVNTEDQVVWKLFIDSLNR